MTREKTERGSALGADPGASRIDLPELARAALEAGKVGLWRWDILSNRVSWSENLEEIHGLAPGSFDGSFEFFLRDIHPEDRQTVMLKIERALAEGADYRVSYRVVSGGNHEEFWVEARGSVIREDGRPVLMTGICQSVSDKRRTELLLKQRVLQQEAVANLGRLALGETSFSGLCQEATRLAAAVLDVDFAELLELQPASEALILKAGIGWRDGFEAASVPADPDTHAGYTLHSDLPVIIEDLTRETRFKPSPLLASHGVVSGIATVIRGDESRFYGVLGVHHGQQRKFTVEDVSFLESIANIIASSHQRQQVEDRRKLVLREMRHRSGNLLAIITSIIARTTESAASVEELGQKLRTRVIALANAHALIMQGGWSTTPIGSLLETSLSAFREQVKTQGRELLLNADMAFPLSMVIHELATNASKYGSLASKQGEVHIAWKVEKNGGGRYLVIRWKEIGGAAEANSEARVGFGSRLIKSVVEQQLSGSFDRSFEPEGLSVVIKLPLAEGGAVVPRL